MNTGAFTISLSAVVFLLQFTSPARANPVENPTPPFKTKLEKLDGQCKQAMDKIEKVIERIESGKKITKKDRDEPTPTDLRPCADSTKAVFDEAAKDAKDAADSTGSRGNTGNLKALEAFAKDQETKHTPKKDKIDEIQRKVKSCEIEVEKGLLEEASPADRESFRDFLDPNCREKLDKQYPELFKRTQLNLRHYASFYHTERSTPKGNDSFSSTLASLFITPADAAQAAGCLNVCITSLDWAHCGQCIKTASSAVSSYYTNTFLPCYSGAGKPWWLPPPLWQAGCVINLTGVVA
jgi:hypothetical protein